MAVGVQDVHSVADGQKFAADQTLEAHTCPACGILHAVPARLIQAARDYPMNQPNGWTLHCPMGHSWGFPGETKEQVLRRELDWERRRSGNLAAQRDQARAEARGQKSAKTRFKNDRDRDRQRIAAGVCPCCNRSFKNLARHMAGQHPEFAHDEEDR